MAKPGGSQSDLGLLMQRAQGGESGRIPQFATQILPILRNAVKRKIYASQHADVEDVVQDVLVSVHVVRATTIRRDRSCPGF